jgi:hypothetical protein
MFGRLMPPAEDNAPVRSVCGRAPGFLKPGRQRLLSSPAVIVGPAQRRTRYLMRVVSGISITRTTSNSIRGNTSNSRCPPPINTGS